MRPLHAYEEFIDFIAAGPSSGKVIAFRLTTTTRQRVFDLVRREKGEGLSVEETAELKHYLQLEHVMRLAKVRARQHLSATGTGAL
jgi:hypothetical protein